MDIFILFKKEYEDDDLELSPIISSKDKTKLNNWLNNFLEESEFYDKNHDLYVKKCKTIVRNYLLNNYGAITSWRDVRERVGKSYPITNEQKDKVIDFLCNNYSYSCGKNIIEVSHNNGFIDKYCDIGKLSKPYPKLPEPPKRPNKYYQRINFKIEKIKSI